MRRAGTTARPGTTPRRCTWWRGTCMREARSWRSPLAHRRMRQRRRLGRSRPGQSRAWQMRLARIWGWQIWRRRACRSQGRLPRLPGCTPTLLGTWPRCESTWAAGCRVRAGSGQGLPGQALLRRRPGFAAGRFGLPASSLLPLLPGLRPSCAPRPGPRTPAPHGPPPSPRPCRRARRHGGLSAGRPRRGCSRCAGRRLG